MSAHTGLLYIVDELDMADEIRHAIGERATFTDAVRRKGYQAKSSALCLLSLDALGIDGACLVRKGNPITTAKSLLRFSRFVDFDPIAFDEYVRYANSPMRRHVVAVLRPGSRSVPQATWQTLWEATKTLRPSVRAQLEQLERATRDEPVVVDGPGADVLIQERDAIGLALDISGMNRRAIMEVSLPRQTTGLVSFLSSLGDLQLSEDTMIEHDTRLLGAWQQLQPVIVGTTSFERADQRLTVFNANRTPIENVLGVDLVYWHHAYRSFVLVQYKKMKKLSTGEPIFRPTGDQYESELQRMRKAASHTASRTPISRLRDFRLYGQAFFFKLCPPSNFRSPPDQLIRGYYFPLDYWDLLVRSSSARGSRGGLGITDKNARRSINNTLFIELLQDGWIGSAGRTTLDLIKLVRDAVSARRAVVVAVSSRISLGQS